MAVPPPGDKWVMPLRRVSGEPSVRLICIPYAGGGPEVFLAWAEGLGDGVELLGLRLPGHGIRLAEPVYTDWNSLVEDAFAALCPFLSEPHALYGHSFGGRLAYELTHLAQAEFPGVPRRLFVSGCRSPNSPQTRPYLHELPDREFIRVMGDMGGTPAEVLENEAMMRLVLPVVRGEIRLAELWRDRHGAGVDVPITAVYGRGDPIDGRASMSGWAGFGPRDCELVEVPGGHFHPVTHPGPLLEIINTRLGATLANADV